jgi:hypothetical protein
MTVDEQELSRLLDETAALASPPRFNVDELTSHIRRRRALAGTTGVGVVMAVAALAVSLPGAFSGNGQQPSISSSPAALLLPASYTITVNGQAKELPVGGASAPDFAITPGEKLAITVEMTMSTRATISVTGLWLGITSGVLASGPNGPADMAPILLADARTSLGPGTHTFTMHWLVPTDLRPGTSRQLSAEETWSGGTTERMIAVFSVRDGSPS